MEDQSLFSICVLLLIVVAYLLIIVGHIAMIVRAFLEGPFQGLCVLIVPMYWLYYGISRIKTRTLFPMSLMMIGFKIGLDTVLLNVYLPRLSETLGWI